ncbi:MAG TPA: hypothetical protein H9825_09270 [Candidatus Sphingobacterium stercorigallinarum]|nr:hypothetical protein [Candidatus Sphingobacterium stercorigallinarum]
MKTLLVTVTILFLSTSDLFGQRLSKADFLGDLEFVYQHLKESVSYRTQKNKHKQVESTYQELKENASDSYYTLDACRALHRLVDVVLDFHNAVFSSNAAFSFNDLKDSLNAEAVLAQTKGFFPFSTVDLDRLRLKLSNSSADAVEGIYWGQHGLKIGIDKQEDQYVGIVLESDVATWTPGEVIAYIIPKGDNHFRIISGTLSKQISQTSDYHREGSFLGMMWLKTPSRSVHYYPEPHLPLYDHQKIGPQIDYLRVGSFQLSQLKTAEAFYDKLQKTGLAKNLIIDLRNNYGGNRKNANLLLQLMKRYRLNTIILTNYATVSAAEQFTLRAKRLKHVLIAGDRTRGTLTYGINYPPKLVSPSGVFKIAFTDLKDQWKKFLPYEGIGVIPDKHLSNDRSWIDQAGEMLMEQPTGEQRASTVPIT